jgi:hypothetical protein
MIAGGCDSVDRVAGALLRVGPRRFANGGRMAPS